MSPILNRFQPRYGVRLTFCLPLLLSGASCAVFAPKPPVAAVKAKVSEIHGQTRVDDYYWLRERNDPHVIDYLKAENAYTEKMLKHTKSLQDSLYREMKSRIKETDLEVPVKVDDYYYYSRTEEGKQYRIRCRKKGSLDAPEEILLDENHLAQGAKYFRIGEYRVSPDHKLLAYSVDKAGNETYTIFIKDLTTGGLRLDEIPSTYYGLEWGNDNKTILYTLLDDAKRPHKLYRHTLGDDPKNDVLVHHETDERFHVSLDKTRSRKYVLLELASQITSEVRVLDADQPTGAFAVIHPRQQGMEYNVEHHGDDFYIVTNVNAINFKLMKAPISSPSKGNWVEVIPHRIDVKLDGVDAFQDHLAVYERDHGLRTLRIRNLKTNEEHKAEFPEPVYTYFAAGNEEFNTPTLRFMYTSLVTPRSVYDYDMNTRQRVLKKRDEVLGGYDPSKYASERIFATAADGIQIPISLVYQKGMQKDGTNPMLLNGYGSYGSPSDPFFQSNRLSLLDRGFIFAIAHIRGGGDLGRPWYEDGKLLHKKNTFTDFIACAEHLIAQGYTSPDKLAIIGGSAGGLLMGAVVNMHPDLFAACIAAVPFVDVVNTMLDDSIPLTVIEYEEWGNPRDKTFYDYMLSYSPYDNVTAQPYPNLLITAGLNDPRVQYWEPAKWTARLRATKTGNNLLLLKTNMGAGHGGASGRYDALRETALHYAFLLDVLGIAQ